MGRRQNTCIQQPIKDFVRIQASVKPEAELVKVLLKMLRPQAMICPLNVRFYIANDVVQRL
ncbi:hypothetical protein EDD64_1368 [Effusibacillus lacus]|nr:hypothetical protein EDD64_1368 [Effusibacillus lacus]